MTMNELAIEIVRMVVRQTQAMKMVGLLQGSSWKDFVIATVKATIREKEFAGDTISVWPAVKEPTI